MTMARVVNSAVEPAEKKERKIATEGPKLTMSNGDFRVVTISSSIGESNLFNDKILCNSNFILTIQSREYWNSQLLHLNLYNKKTHETIHRDLTTNKSFNEPNNKIHLTSTGHFIYNYEAKRGEASELILFDIEKNKFIPLDIVWIPHYNVEEDNKNNFIFWRQHKNRGTFSISYLSLRNFILSDLMMIEAEDISSNGPIFKLDKENNLLNVIDHQRNRIGVFNLNENGIYQFSHWAPLTLPKIKPSFSYHYSACEFPTSETPEWRRSLPAITSNGRSTTCLNVTYEGQNISVFSPLSSFDSLIKDIPTPFFLATSHYHSHSSFASLMNVETGSFASITNSEFFPRYSPSKYDDVTGDFFYITEGRLSCLEFKQIRDLRKHCEKYCNEVENVLERHAIPPSLNSIVSQYVFGSYSQEKSFISRCEERVKAITSIESRPLFDSKITDIISSYMGITFFQSNAMCESPGYEVCPITNPLSTKRFENLKWMKENSTGLDSVIIPNVIPNAAPPPIMFFTRKPERVNLIKAENKETTQAVNPLVAIHANTATRTSERPKNKTKTCIVS